MKTEIKHVKCYKKDYPRPQFVKDGFTNLNGKWAFCFDDANEGESKGFFNKFPDGKTINVPFSYQSQMSGIGDDTRHDNIWYNRTFKANIMQDKRLLIHFEGCDFITKLWINGVFVGMHRGGYCRFSFDITHFVKNGENTITVKAEDSYDAAQPRGKQRWQDKNFGCWYEDTNGIWKTVWLEEVSSYYLQGVRITPDFDTESVEFTFNTPYIRDGLSIRTIVTKGENKVVDFETAITRDEQITKVQMLDEAEPFKIWQWGVGHPNLYDVEFILKLNGEEIEKTGSYFAMRKISISNGVILLNDVPIYLKMLLDQGYWKESHLTPPDEEAIIKDIVLTKEMGYNGIRKHQKIEDERFYYYCDILGILVWCEMPSAYDFSDRMTKNFILEWTEAVIQMRNHPSIMAWVPFNESWGVTRIMGNAAQQAVTETSYFLTKTLDGEQRPVISNDGWEHTRSDIITIHNYAENGAELAPFYSDKERALSDALPLRSKRVFAEGYYYEGQPVIISEYGGIAFVKDSKAGWGYGNFVKDEKAFIERLSSLNRAIRDIPYVQGYCLTQTTDVMQEVNGLLDMQRNPKIPVDEIKKLND